MNVVTSVFTPHHSNTVGVLVVGLGCRISRNSRSINKRMPISLKNDYHKSFLSTVAHAFLVH